jgi:hypothetical protein
MIAALCCMFLFIILLISCLHVFSLMFNYHTKHTFYLVFSRGETNCYNLRWAAWQGIQMLICYERFVCIMLYVCYIVLPVLKFVYSMFLVNSIQS